MVAGDTAAAFGKDGAVIAQPLAALLNVKPGDSCMVTYTTKFDPHAVTIKLSRQGGV